MRRLLAALLLFAAPAVAQRSAPPRSYTATSLPAAASRVDICYLVTDAASAADCSTGSGGRVHWCCSDGSAWEPRSGPAIDTSGNVGINTLAPSVPLEVLLGGTAFSYNASTAMGVQNSTTTSNGVIFSMIGGTAGNAQLAFGDTDSEFRGRFIYDHVNDRFRLFTAGSEVANIRSDGKFGIGVTGPSKLLHVKETTDTDVLRLEDSDGTCDQNPESGSITTTCSSSAARKKNIRPAEKGRIAAGLAAVPLVEYETTDSEETKVGWVAETVRLIAPERVVERPTQECAEVPSADPASPGEVVCAPGPPELAVKLPSTWELLAMILELRERVEALEARPGAPTR